MHLVAIAFMFAMISLSFGMAELEGHFKVVAKTCPQSKKAVPVNGMEEVIVRNGAQIERVSTVGDCEYRSIGRFKVYELGSQKRLSFAVSESKYTCRKAGETKPARPFVLHRFSSIYDQEIRLTETGFTLSSQENNECPSGGGTQIPREALVTEFQRLSPGEGAVMTAEAEI